MFAKIYASFDTELYRAMTLPCIYRYWEILYAEMNNVHIVHYTYNEIKKTYVKCIL